MVKEQADAYGLSRKPDTRTMRALSFSVLCGCVAQTVGFGVVVPARGSPVRHAPAEMKGKGTRGMPGKGVRPPSGSGFNDKSKKRMQKRDFERSEWTPVALKGELGDEIGSSMAVEAGQSPMFVCQRVNQAQLLHAC
jgi:hypothetical protein